MVFTNAGKKLVALSLGSDLGLYINYVGVGTGSGEVTGSNTTLVSEQNRVSITGSPDFSTDQEVSFQADFNSVQMSGLNLTEFGLFNTGSDTGFPGSAWLREGFGSVVFDGTNELQIISTIKVI